MKRFALLGLVVLAACSKSDDKATTPPSGATGSVAAAGSSWKVLDACATLDKAKVAAATGAAVTSTDLGGVNEGEGGMASLSTCTYTLDNGGSIGVLIRELPDDNDPPGDYRKSSEAMGMTLEPVTGLGKEAFWVPAMTSLQVFVDKRRYTAINYSTPPKSADAKTALTTIAKDLGA